jgi:hypothetical protein
MLVLDVRVSDDTELDLLGPVADESTLPFFMRGFKTDAPRSNPRADPGWPALSSLGKLSMNGVACGPPSGRGCGRMSGE